MTREEYQKKIDELNEQKVSLNTQIVQVNKEFQNSLLRELEEQGITTGTKVSVKKRKHGVVMKLIPKLTSLEYLSNVVV